MELGFNCKKLGPIILPWTKLLFLSALGRWCGKCSPQIERVRNTSKLSILH